MSRREVRGFLKSRAGIPFPESQAPAWTRGLVPAMSDCHSERLAELAAFWSRYSFDDSTFLVGARRRGPIFPGRCPNSASSYRQCSDTERESTRHPNRGVAVPSASM
jgi:hypothetical protein